MRAKAIYLLGPLLPLLPLTGCNLLYYGSHNLINEPISRLDEHKFTSRLEAESRTVWREVCQQFPARTFTPEFADGFTDGYVDYLDNGGNPSPPTVPPLRYRRSSYLTPQGHALAKDYLIGFQYGAEVGAATGKRQFLTVPVLLPETPPEQPLQVTRLPAPPETSTDVPGSVKPTPKLPPIAPGTPDPRPLPEASVPGVLVPPPVNPPLPGSVPPAGSLPTPRTMPSELERPPTTTLPGTVIPTRPFAPTVPIPIPVVPGTQTPIAPTGPLPPGGVGVPGAMVPPIASPMLPVGMPTTTPRPTPPRQPIGPATGEPVVIPPASEPPFVIPPVTELPPPE